MVHRTPAFCGGGWGGYIDIGQNQTHPPPGVGGGGGWSSPLTPAHPAPPPPRGRGGRGGVSKTSPLTSILGWTPALCEGQSLRPWFGGWTPVTHPLGGGGRLLPGGIHPPPGGIHPPPRGGGSLSPGGTHPTPRGGGYILPDPTHPPPNVDLNVARTLDFRPK
jgi:hypothetical protein